VTGEVVRVYGGEDREHAALVPAPPSPDRLVDFGRRFRRDEQVILVGLPCSRNLEVAHIRAIVGPGVITVTRVNGRGGVEPWHAELALSADKENASGLAVQEPERRYVARKFMVLANFEVRKKRPTLRRAPRRSAANSPPSSPPTYQAKDLSSQRWRLSKP
jgi:hypothetical protein